NEDSHTWDFGYHATPYERAVIAYGVMQKVMPVKLHSLKLPPPNVLLAQRGIPPNSSYGETVSQKSYLDVFSIANSLPSLLGTHSDAKQGAKRFAKEEARGLYKKMEAIEAREAATVGG